MDEVLSKGMVAKYALPPPTLDCFPSAGFTRPDRFGAVLSPAAGRSDLLGIAVAAILPLARIRLERAGGGQASAVESLQRRGRAAAGQLPDRAAVPAELAVCGASWPTDDGMAGHGASAAGGVGHVATDWSA